MRARTRDRRVYLTGHPVLFALLAATRRWPVLRLGRTVLVHGRDAYVAALTRVPLDRTADGTTGGAADRLGGADTFFDQQGDAHRRTRRSTAEALGAAGVARLRPVWTEILDRRLAPLAAGADLDLVPLAAELSGTTAAALLGLPVDGRVLADAARQAGASAVREHLPGMFRGRSRRAAIAAAERLTALVAPRGDAEVTPHGGAEAGRSAMLAVAAINTSMAALPRAVAWCADDDLWSYAHSHPRSLADELLRVTAPAPLLPRVAAADSTLPTGCPTGGDGWAPSKDTPPSGCPDHGDGRAPSSGAPPSGLTCSGPTGSPPSGSTGSSRAGSPTSGSTCSGRAGGPPSGSINDGRNGGELRIRKGDRLLLVARHAIGAHRDDPDPVEPAAAQVAQLVFGIGPHACPGARLARAQLVDLLVALAPYRPVVVRSRVDRSAALPGWASLVVRASGSRRTSANTFDPDIRTADPVIPAAEPIAQAADPTQAARPNTQTADPTQSARPNTQTTDPALAARQNAQAACPTARAAEPNAQPACPAARTADGGA
jgi:cytochrome P450